MYTKVGFDLYFGTIIFLLMLTNPCFLNILMAHTVYFYLKSLVPTKIMFFKLQYTI